MFNSKISSFSDLLQDRGNISDLLLLYSDTIIGKMSHDELQNIASYFDEWINAPGFDLADFCDACRFSPEELAPALGEVEDDEEASALIEEIEDREKRPLYDFLREEGLFDWYYWQIRACDELKEILAKEFEVKFAVKNA